MKTCCDTMCANHGCNQGRNCPARKAAPVTQAKPKFTQAPARRRTVPTWLLDLLGVIAMVVAIVWLLGYYGPSLDSHATEWRESQALIDAQRAALSAFRRDMAAAKLCRQEHGESGFTWAADGGLVCLPRHGRRQLAANP